jgi:hypothetical protein
MPADEGEPSGTKSKELYEGIQPALSLWGLHPKRSSLSPGRWHAAVHREDRKTREEDVLRQVDADDPTSEGSGFDGNHYAGASRIVVHTWNRTDELDGRGYHVLDKHKNRKILPRRNGDHPLTRYAPLDLQHKAAT